MKNITRTAEFVLGLLGGIFGLIAAVIALFIGGLGSALNLSGASTISGLGFLAIVASIIGIVGAAIVKSKTKVAGILMIIAAVVGIVAVSMFYILPAILLAIAGILALVKKEKSK